MSRDQSGEPSRRRFLAAITASTAPFAGCETRDSGGTTTTTTARSRPSAVTVRWGVSRITAAENGDAIRTALHESGLPERITVEFVPGAPDTGRRRRTYDAVLAAGTPRPDLFLMDVGWTNLFVERDLLSNLSETLPASLLTEIGEQYFTGITATARDPGTGDLYGVPVFVDLATMQYRRDLVERTGYDPVEEGWATEPLTWEEWSHVIADVLDSHGEAVAHGFTTQWAPYEGTACCTFNETLTSWGGAYFGGPANLFGPVGKRPVTVDTPPTRDALRMMRRFVHGEDYDAVAGYASDIAPAAILDWKEQQSRRPLANREAVMHRDWPTALARYGADPETTDGPALGTDLGAMPLPYAVGEDTARFPGTGGTSAALGGWHLTLNPNSGRVDAAIEVVRAAMTDEFLLRMLEVNGWLPPKPGLFETSRARDVDVLGRYIDTLRVAGENAIPRPVTPAWPDESTAIAETAHAVVDRQLSPEAGAARLATRLDRIESRTAQQTTAGERG